MDKYEKRIKKTLGFIFLMSLSLVTALNIFYFNFTKIKFTSDNFLALLPFNLILLSLSLKLLLVIYINILK
tara:strand:+ start:2934 stop:3146 length:213 start_codon:yes stop_codon:yes gene_type:complete